MTVEDTNVVGGGNNVGASFNFNNNANIMDNDLPQLLDSGGADASSLEVDDFSNWKDMMLGSDGLEPFFLENLENGHEGPSKTRDTKIATLRLKFNAFKALDGEKVAQTYTIIKILLNDLENNRVSIP
ncbi:hypothetical protein Tco_1281643 [Tanacetum coccineum]